MITFCSVGTGDMDHVKRCSSCSSKPGICSNPTAVINTQDDVRGSRFSRGQRYQVIVELEMPESPSNRNLGMFGVRLITKNEDNGIIESISRSALMKYKSPVIQTLSTIVYSPFLLWGVKEEKQILSILLHTNFLEDPLNIVHSILIELDSRFIEIYSGRLKVQATFSGLRYFMHTYPYLTALLCTMISMTFFTIILLFSWYQFSPNWQESRHTKVLQSLQPKNELAREAIYVAPGKKLLEAEIETLSIEKSEIKAPDVTSQKEFQLYGNEKKFKEFEDTANQRSKVEALFNFTEPNSQKACHGISDSDIRKRQIKRGKLL